MILQLLGTGLVLLQGWWYVKDELHRCPVCRDEGIVDVERHCVIFHPGPFTPRYEDGPDLGVDPRPDETELNVYVGQLRRFVERNRR